MPRHLKTLRQRHDCPGAADNSVTKKQNGNQSCVEKILTPTLQHDPASWTKYLFVAIALAVLLLLASNPAEQRSDTYALCSEDGNQIYTVDEFNSQKQCIVVRDSLIVYTGSLRKCWKNYR